MKSAEYISEYNRLIKEFDSIYHAQAVRLGLSDCAFWILYILSDESNLIKQSDLADNTSLPPQTINSALKKLESEGLVTLNKIEGKMGKSIHLTKQGKAWIDKNILPLKAIEEEVCDSFTAKEKETFLKLFDMLVKRLEGKMPDNG